MNTKPVGVKTIPLQQFTTFSALPSLQVFSDSDARDDIVHLRLWHFSTLSICLLSMLLSVTSRQAAQPPTTDTGLPYLRKQGTATQLIVDGQPFVMLAGELHNSSASGIEHMKTLWPKLKELGLNAVLALVSWELLEPREEEFDSTLVDALLEQARTHHHRLVLLWFGSWKNGVSSCAPRWVLQDTKRFPRARGSAGRNTKESFAPLGEASRKAGAAAFARLMRHLKQVDAREWPIASESGG